MAIKLLNSWLAIVPCMLVPGALLTLSATGHAQETLRPGCVTRYDNGRPYVFCEEEEKNRDRYRPGPLWDNDLLRSERPTSAPSAPAPLPPVASPPPVTAPAPSYRYETVVPRPSSGAPGGASPRPTQSAPAARPAPSERVGTPVGAGPTAAPVRSRPYTVRALIEPAEMPPRQLAGYGIVAFTTRPQANDMERYKSVCEAYKATLMSQAELPPNTPLAEQMITYWPITNKNTAEAQRADCPHLVTNYALRLGLDAIQDADKQGEGLASRRGPFLIAWAPSESRFVPDAVVLVMDLSKLDGQRSFTEVFQDWR